MSCFFSRLRMNARPALWGAISVVLLLVASAMCSVVAMAAVVSLQPPPANEALLRIPVILTGEGDEDLAGVQFDLNYDATQYTLESIETGAAASDAGKDVILSQPAPGRGRVLITGFNNNTLFDGHVATLILRPRTPDAAAYSLAIENLLATDPLGSSVPIDYANDYSYPPLPPEKTEADLAESSTEGPGEGEVESISDLDTTDASPRDSGLSSGENATLQDAVASGYGGGLATPLDDPASSSRAARNDTSQDRVAPRIQALAGAPGFSAPSRPRTVAARPSRQRPRAPFTSRNTRPNVSSPARPAIRSTNVSGSTETNAEIPSRSPAPAYRRLALVMPTAPIAESGELHPSAELVLNEGVELSVSRSDYRVVGFAFFLMFFIAFGTLHISVFRWLSSSTGRRRA